MSRAARHSRMSWAVSKGNAAVFCCTLRFCCDMAGLLNANADEKYLFGFSSSAAKRRDYC